MNVHIGLPETTDQKDLEILELSLTVQNFKDAQLFMEVLIRSFAANGLVLNGVIHHYQADGKVTSLKIVNNCRIAPIGESGEALP